MAALNGSLLGTMAKAIYIGKSRKLPVEWKQPGDQYPDAFPLPELVRPTPSPSKLFQSPSQNKYHVDAVNDVGGKIATYIDGICSAIGTGSEMWTFQAKFSNLKINGPVGLVSPGSLSGPPLKPHIMATAPMATPQEIKYSKAIAGALDDAWDKWAKGVTGVLMYPAFVAFPGPMAPPTPNVPMPLIALPSTGAAALAPGALKSKMSSELGDKNAMHAEDIFDSIAQAFMPVFQLFLATKMVMNVLGKGPIPTFAPPFVPVGPVVMGDNIGLPGHLAL